MAIFPGVKFLWIFLWSKIFMVFMVFMVIKKFSGFDRFLTGPLAPHNMVAHHHGPCTPGRVNSLFFTRNLYGARKWRSVARKWHQRDTHFLECKEVSASFSSYEWRKMHEHARKWRSVARRWHQCYTHFLECKCPVYKWRKMHANDANVARRWHQCQCPIYEWRKMHALTALYFFPEKFKKR